MIPRFLYCSVSYRLAYIAGLLGLATLLMVPRLSAQTETATILGRVSDQSGAVVKGVEVEIRNIDTNVATTSSTNAEGLYAIHSLIPGRYVISVHKQGFKTVSLVGLNLNVQDNLIRNFTLQIGAVSESITVSADSNKINITDGTVSTVIDRNFAENLPMNGRSFQSLIQLAPGVVTVPSNAADGGQFSVNGQRAASNYWMVDGVSANIGMGTSTTGGAGNGLAGSLGSFSALGGTNSLVSEDAMQEFRIQTSTYAPEFGRTPGAQVSIVTRSGTNQLHGTAFDYLRNDLLDANNWFADNAGLTKPKERQNDFGGTLGGPIQKDRTFFFFSYEGLRLRLPQTALTTVPCDSTCLVFGNARALAVPAMQPYLNMYPLPNGPEVFRPCVANVNGCPASGENPTGSAQFNSSYSDPATLDAYSIRLDHKVSDKLSLFGRYDYSPSRITQRGTGNSSLSTLNTTESTTQTGTAGATTTLLPLLINDLRFNYSRATASVRLLQDGFGGASPLESFPFPDPFNSQNGTLFLSINGLRGGVQRFGGVNRNLQSQINVVDSLSWQKGVHSLKFGVDFRRLSPEFTPFEYQQLAFFSSLSQAENGNAFARGVFFNSGATFLFKNIGIYAQDTWHASHRLSLTYGVRWDIDFSPRSTEGPAFPAIAGFNLNDFSHLSLASPGKSPFDTPLGNFAPRLGLAYELSNSKNRQTVLRGGFGVFYDLATSELGNLIVFGGFPFGASSVLPPGAFPLNPTEAVAPAVTSPTATGGGVFGLDPHLQLPYTLEWNVAIEQGLGQKQTVSASYVGAAGRRLLQTLVVQPPTLAFANVVTNAGSSDYDALQIQYQRMLSHGLQVLASYSWGHSIDTGSAGSPIIGSNQFLPGDIASNRASSDFDIRHAFSAAVTYDIPAPNTNAIAKAVLRGWSLENIALARSALPVDVSDQNFTQFNGGIFAEVRPDLVVGQPLYVTGSQCLAQLGAPCPGGKAFNPNAFTDPPVDPNTFNPVRQGNVPRNFLRGFGAIQWDLAIHRTFPVRESLKLQLRAEMFNVLNHPNFAPPGGGWPFPPFGLSTQTLGQFLNGGGTGLSNAGGGAFNPLYQIGGPRSIQMALKVEF